MEYDPATQHYTCRGTSKLEGSLKGSTTWKIDWIFDSTGYVGTEREVFTGRVVDHGRGRLVLSEKWSMDLDGQNFRNHGPIVKSSGDLAGLRGSLKWTGSIDPPTGVGSGSYAGRFYGDNDGKG